MRSLEDTRSAVHEGILRGCRDNFSSFLKKVAIKFVFVIIVLYNGGAWGKYFNLHGVE